MADALLIKAARDIMEKRGVSAVYYEPVDKFPTPCLVRVDQDVLISKENYDYDQSGDEYGTVAEFLKADLAPDRPERGGVIRIGFDEEWELTHPIRQDGIFERWAVVKHD